MARTINDLRQMQSLPLSLKIALTQSRIRQWVNEYGEDGVYISFSGGKDSTVLCDIVDKMYPENTIPKVFVNTGLEYPELVSFVKQQANVVIIRPEMNFKKVVEKYGYPFPTKEAAECISGAQRYLNELLDRQTDRQTDSITFHTSISMTSYADSECMRNPSRGGGDSRYRKLRGIGEFAKTQEGLQKRRGELPNSANVGNADKEERDSSGGEYP